MAKQTVAKLLPAELFMPGRLWLVATYPVSAVVPDCYRRVQFVVEAGGSFVPVFTSKEAAESYFDALPDDDDDADILAPFRFNDLQHLGHFLDGLVGIGHTHLAFDPPESDRDAQRIPISIVTAELRRCVFGSPGEVN